MEQCIINTWWNDFETSSIIEVYLHNGVRALRKRYHAFKVVVDRNVPRAVDFK